MINTPKNLVILILKFNIFSKNHKINIKKITDTKKYGVRVIAVKGEIKKENKI